MQVELKVGTPHGEWHTVIVTVPENTSDYVTTLPKFWQNLVEALPEWTPSNIAFIHVVGRVDKPAVVRLV